MEKQTLCAYCGEKGHKQSECLSMTPKCINCGDPHRTLAAQCPIRKGLIKTRRKEIRQRSRSRSRSQPRVNTQTTTEVPYAEMAAAGAVPKRRTEQINISCEPEMKRITTIILSSNVYSQYKEMIEPGTFQQNMDTMFEENGLQKVKFPKQTNIQGMKELYQDILKSKLETEHEISDEAFSDVMEEEMEMEMTNKRQRDPSISPQLVMDPKKKKNIEENKDIISQTKTLKLQPQEKPPVPPPMQRPPRSQREKKEDTSKKEAESEAELSISERIQLERGASARPRTSSQSLTTLVGPTGSTKQLSSKELNIKVFIPKTDNYNKMFARGLTKDNKEEIIKALFKNQAKMKWDHASVKKEQILSGINCRIIGLNIITFSMVNMEDYVKIREGPTQPK